MMRGIILAIAVALAERILSRMPRSWPRRWGLTEVTLYAGGGALDFVRRHMELVNQLEAFRRRAGLRVLEVLDYGGAYSPVSTFLRAYGLAGTYRVTVVDVDAAAIEAAVLRDPLVAKVTVKPEGVLPFRAHSFDVIVSSDVFEHIPRSMRPHWAKELERVTRLGQVHRIPADGPGYGSTAADATYQEWYVRRTGAPDPWTAEHLLNGVPTIDELSELFPGAHMRGTANIALWQQTMREEHEEPGALARVRRGLRYWRRQQRLDAEPPFKACLVALRAPSADFGLGSEPRVPNA